MAEEELEVTDVFVQVLPQKASMASECPRCRCR
jgi:hypothetical protein